MRTTLFRALTMFVPAVWIASLPQPAAQVRTPQAVLDELLAADRAFSQAGEKTDLVSGLAPPFIVGRSGYGEGHTGHVVPSMSSTDVRAAVASGDLAFLQQAVPRAVLKRIMEKGLYAV